MKNIIQIGSVCAAFLFSLPLQAQTPWLPVPQTISFTVDRTTEEATQFYRGGNKVDLPFGHFDQSVTWISAKWGVSDKTAIDARMGIAEVDTGIPMGDFDGERTDTTFGITRSLRDEFETGDFSLAMRVAVSTAGDYPVGQPNTIGDGEDSWDVGLSVGKLLSAKVATAASYTLSMNGGHVPQESTFTVGGNFQVTPEIGLYSVYENQRSNGKLDIGAPGFSPARFPETQENFSRLRIGATATTPFIQLDASYANVLDGRNMADFKTWSVSATYMLDLFGL